MAKKTPEQVETYAYNLALWHLSKRPMTIQQVRDKLISKLVPENVADATIERLVAYGALNDADYAEMYTRTAVKVKRLSKSSIGRELSHRGVSPDDAEEALGTVTADVEYENALALAVKKHRATRSTPDPAKRRRKIVTAVVAKGYSWELAARVTDTVLEDDPDDAIQDETL